MADKPILFSAPMVRALLDGRKTQTRRLLKHKVIDLRIAPRVEIDHPKWIQFLHPKGGPLTCVKWPYATGDRLWVRESMDLGCRGYLIGHATYAADGADVDLRPAGAAAWAGDYKRQAVPPIHMPRWASRLTLTVTDVRVQRLQEISAEDIAAEGACEFAMLPPTDDETFEARGVFRDLWNSLNGPDAWHANPWVAAISFDVHRCNIDQMGRDG